MRAKMARRWAWLVEIQKILRRCWVGMGVEGVVERLGKLRPDWVTVQPREVMLNPQRRKQHRQSWGGQVSSTEEKGAKLEGAGQPIMMPTMAKKALARTPRQSS